MFTLRLIFGALAASALLILYVLTFIFDRTGSPDPGLGVAVIAAGVAGICAAAWASRRPLNVSGGSALAKSYRDNFFIGFALNQAPLMVAFVLSFLGNEMWPYLVALPLYGFGMAVIAPSTG